MKYIITIITSLILSVNSFSQDYEVTHYTVEDGLMSNTIQDIFEDSLGVIWVANGLGFTKFYGDKVENVTGFEDEWDWSRFKKSNNMFFSDYYILDGNGIRSIKKWDEVKRVYYGLKQNGELSTTYFREYSSKNKQWRYVLRGDSINYDYFKFNILTGDSINLLNKLKAIDPSYADFELLRNSMQEEDKIWFHSPDSSFLVINLENGEKLTDNLPLHFIYSIISLNDSTTLFNGVDTILKEHVIFLRIKDKIIHRDLPYFIYERNIKYDRKGSFFFKFKRGLYTFNGSNIVKIFEFTCSDIDFNFNLNNELIVTERCWGNGKYNSRLINVTNNNTLIDNVEVERLGFFIDNRKNIYSFGESGFTKYAKTNYEFNKWSSYAGGENLKAPMSLIPNQKLNNNGKIEILPSDTIYGFRNDSIFKGSEFHGVLPSSDSYKTFGQFLIAKNMYFTFKSYKKEGEWYDAMLSVDSNLQSTWFSKGFKDKRFEYLTFKNEKFYLIGNHDIWKKHEELFKRMNPETLDSSYKLLQNEFFRNNSDPNQIVDFEVFKSENDSTEALVFDYKSEQYYLDSLDLFKKINVKPSKFKNGWFAFQQEISFLYTNGQLTEIYEADFKDLQFYSSFYSDDYNDHLYLQSADGLFILDYTEDSIIKLYDQDDLFKRELKYFTFNSDTTAIWFLTTQGVHRFDLNAYYEKEEIIIDDFPLKETQGYKIEFVGDSILRIYDLKGFGEMKIGKYRYIPPAPKLHFSSLRLNYENFDWSQTTTKIDSFWGNVMPYNMELAHDQNHLTFDFQGVSHSNKKPLQYFHQLEGEDEKFYSSTNKSVTYSNLDPGKYTLKVYVQDENESKSETLSCSFTVKPPFWKTWWFISLCALAIGGVLYSGYQFNVRRLKARQEELEEEVERATAEVVKQKNEIEGQRNAIQHQKEEVEEAHREITDSINYAERIQRSFLATNHTLQENLNEFFVYFNPKEAVSGDFYWAGKLANGNFALVNADSTGHGVPGAIMSILNISSIEKAVDQNLTSPAEIFNETRKTIIERLKNDGSEEGGKDGMDASLVAFNSAKTIMTYVAAQNPIWIIRDGELTEIKPEKMPVGKHDNDHKSFVGGEYAIQKGDIIYTLTDGFQDQFGGVKGKKFMIKKMREYVLSISNLSMAEQHLKIKETFANWKGDLEQIDDVCVIGIRI
jgi:serine phosphatase RsbU (regulator of sigma subunit)